MDRLAKIQSLFGEQTAQSDAVRHYDLLRAGFYWSDELPSTNSKEYLAALHLLIPIIAYRGSLTRKHPLKRFEPEWEEFKQAVPSWHGFATDRVESEQLRRDLKARKLKESKCLKAMEEVLESDPCFKTGVIFLK